MCKVCRRHWCRAIFGVRIGFGQHRIANHPLARVEYMFTSQVTVAWYLGCAELLKSRQRSAVRVCCCDTFVCSRCTLSSLRIASSNLAAVFSMLVTYHGLTMCSYPGVSYCNHSSCVCSLAFSCPQRISWTSGLRRLCSSRETSHHRFLGVFCDSTS